MWKTLSNQNFCQKNKSGGGIKLGPTLESTPLDNFKTFIWIKANTISNLKRSQKLSSLPQSILRINTKNQESKFSSTNCILERKHSLTIFYCLYYLQHYP